MNSLEYEFAVKWTNKLLEHPLCIEFSKPIPKNEAWSEAYFNLIKNPMDLSTVKSKLENQEYKNVEEWKQDIHQIWENGKEFNGPRALISVMCDLLDKKCQKTFAHIPRSENDIAKFRIDKINRKIKKLLDMDLPENSLSPRLPFEVLNEPVEL